MSEEKKEAIALVREVLNKIDFSQIRCLSLTWEIVGGNILVPSLKVERIEMIMTINKEV